MAVAADVNDDESGTVAVDATSELGIIGTRENILLNSVSKNKYQLQFISVFAGSIFYI